MSVSEVVLALLLSTVVIACSDGTSGVVRSPPGTASLSNVGSTTTSPVVGRAVPEASVCVEPVAEDPEPPAPQASPPDATDADPVAAAPVLHDFEYGEGDCAPDEKPGDLPRRPSSEPPFAFDDAPPLCIDPDSDYTATFVTSEGEIVVDLHTDRVPGTVNNFVNLANWGYYDDTVIFRGAQSIGMIQGGGTTNTDRPGYNIPDEGEAFTYEAGQLAMARTAEPDSAGQWFFNVNDNAAALDAQGTYVVFGTVTDGLEVTDEILSLFQADEMTPQREVTLESVTITES